MVAAVVCGLWYALAHLEIGATAQDADEARVLAERVENEARSFGITVDVFCRPSPRANALLIYGDIDASLRREMAAITKKVCNELKCKKTVINFYRGRRYDSRQEKPVEVDVIDR